MNKFDEDVIIIEEDNVEVEDVKEEKNVKTFIDKHFGKILLGGLGLIIALSSGLDKRNKNKSINAQNRLQSFMDGYYLGKESKNDFNRK